MTEIDKGSAILVRRAEDLVREALFDTPIVMVQGARQVGKSTLVARITRDLGSQLLTLDSEPALLAASADPASFVRQQPERTLVIDEIQLVPELLRAMKLAVDEDRRPGRFLVTGSANLLTIPGHHESLAGRAETVPLYGLSQGELHGSGDRLSDLLFAADQTALTRLNSSLTRGDYIELICAGGYPEARLRTGRRRSAWFDNYLARVLDRDARYVSRLTSIDRLPRLLRLLAANTSGELVKARLAGDADLPETSLPGYLELLEALFLIRTIPAWGGSLTQRVVVRPKVTLLDTGLAAHLNNLSPEALAPVGAGAAFAGRLVESFVAGELCRQSTWAEHPFELRHYRDRHGAEVDLVLEDASRRVVGIEVKASTKVEASDLRGLNLLADRLGDRFVMGAVLYTGREAIRMASKIWALPLSALWS